MFICRKIEGVHAYLLKCWRGTCSSVGMLKEYMVRERLGTPDVDVEDKGCQDGSLWLRDVVFKVSKPALFVVTGGKGEVAITNSMIKRNMRLLSSNRSYLQVQAGVCLVHNRLLFLHSR